MKFNLLRIFLVSIFAIPFFIISCDEDEINDLLNSADVREEMAMDNKNLASGENDIFFLVSSRGITEDLEGDKKDGECPNVTFQGNAYPAEMIIDFGDGCQFREKERKGIVRANFSQTWDGTVGMSVVITMENYFVDNVKHQGTMTLTYNGDEGNPSFTMVATDNKLIYPADTSGNNPEVSWSSAKTFTWLNGFDGFTGIESDNVFNDDIFTISGTTNGVNRNSNDFSVIIADDNPLYYDISCEYIKSGIITITETSDTVSVTTIDFSPSEGETTGDCDNLVTITTDNLPSITTNLE